jgi:hypothetical protein
MSLIQQQKLQEYMDRQKQKNKWVKYLVRRRKDVRDIFNTGSATALAGQAAHAPKANAMRRTPLTQVEAKRGYASVQTGGSLMAHGKMEGVNDSSAFIRAAARIL